MDIEDRKNLKLYYMRKMQWIAVIGELLKSTAQASENSGGCVFLAVFTGFPRLLEGPGFFS